ncbi:hypothetical protein C8R44DRAFT_887829 [Mycena epipterygia]|nr:hypothetical protein C8R44DRAFT_887829 [Mycena epipterygia]
MPPATQHAEHAGALLKFYIRNHKGRQRRALLRRCAAVRAHCENPRLGWSTFDVDLGLDLQSDTSSDTLSSSSHSSASSSDSHWSDLLGPNCCFMSEILVDHEYSVTELDLSTDSIPSSASQVMPDLFSVSSDSSESESESDSDWNWSSRADGDDEQSGDSADDSDDQCLPLRLPTWRH